MLRKKIVFPILIGAITIFSTFKVNAASIDVKRIWGNDRYETCSKIVQEGWKVQSDYAVVVNGENFPDALSASTLAKKYNAPILLTEDNKIDDFAYNELKRLGVKHVFIVGGEGVIKTSVGEKIHSLNIDVKRFCGLDRTETSIKVAEEIGTQNGVILTTDSDFTDALSVAPIAAKLQMPIILMPKDSTPQSVENFLKDKKLAVTYVLGDNTLISDNVVSKFSNVKRIEGKDKYERNINIIKAFEDKLNFDKIFCAYSEKFADALSGSAFAAIDSNPIVLLGDEPTAYTKDYMKSKDSKVKNLNILGGTAGIKNKSVKDIYGNECTIEEEINENSSNDGKIESNGSFAIRDDEWIYYSGNREIPLQSDAVIRSELYRVKTDESKREKLTNDYASKIWSSGDYIYYINYKGERDNNSLYRVNKNGTEKSVVIEDTPISLVFSGEYIYYSKYSIEDSCEKFAIYKVKVDGTDKQRVSDIKGIGLKSVGNYIYYQNSEDEYKVYRINLDGSGKQLICNDSTINYMNIDGEFIYYCNNDDSDNLYRVKLDGTGREKLNYDTSRNINISDNYIYYSGINADGGSTLYRMRTNGLGREVISSLDSSTSIAVKGDYVYFCGYNSQGIHRIKKDGTDIVRLNYENTIIYMETVGNWIYYETLNTASMTKKLKKISLDGQSEQIVK